MPVVTLFVRGDQANTPTAIAIAIAPPRSPVAAQDVDPGAAYASQKI